MIYTQIPLANLPINLILLPETTEVAFVVVQQFKLVYDMSTDGEDAYFDMEGFSIGTEEYEYNKPYKYKEIPSMLNWLVSQRLVG